MRLNKQEEHIRQKMRSFEPDIDTVQLWNSLEGYVPKKKKKRKIIFFLSLAASVVAIIFIALLIGNDGVKNQKAISKVQDNIVMNKKENDIVGNTNFLPEEKASKPQSAMSINKYKSNNTLNTVNDQINKNTKNKIRQNQNSKSKFAGEKPNNDLLPKEINDLVKNNDAKSKNYKNTGNTTKNTHIENEIITCSHLQSKKPLLLSRQKHFQLKPEVILKEKNRELFVWDLGIGFAFSQYSASAANQGQDDRMAYLNTISATKPALSMHFGLIYNLHKNYYISTGLQLERFVTALHPAWTKIEKENVKKENGLVQRVTKQKDYSAIGYRYYYTLDLPLDAAVVLYNKSRFSLALEAGMSVNMRTYIKGAYLDNERMLSYHNNTYSDFDMAWHSSFVINYYVKQHYVLYLKPGVFTKRMNYNIDDLDMQETFTNFKLCAGLKF